MPRLGSLLTASQGALERVRMVMSEMLVKSLGGKKHCVTLLDEYSGLAVVRAVTNELRVTFRCQGFARDLGERRRGVGQARSHCRHRAAAGTLRWRSGARRRRGGPLTLAGYIAAAHARALRCLLRGHCPVDRALLQQTRSRVRESQQPHVVTSEGLCGAKQ